MNTSLHPLNPAARQLLGAPDTGGIDGTLRDGTEHNPMFAQGEREIPYHTQVNRRDRTMSDTNTITITDGTLLSGSKGAGIGRVLASLLMGAGVTAVRVTFADVGDDITNAVKASATKEVVAYAARSLNTADFAGFENGATEQESDRAKRKLASVKQSCNTALKSASSDRRVSTIRALGANGTMVGVTLTTRGTK
jgi:hypothetical protein